MPFDPTLGPSGAKTLLHDSANASENVPPQASWWALSICLPSTVVDVSIGNVSLTLTSPLSSAAVVVTSLKVEPGGCGAEYAIPATARTSPVRAWRATTPP